MPMDKGAHVDVRTNLFVGGTWKDAHANPTIEVENPATGRVFGSVPSATLADVDEAVEVAREALHSSGWAERSMADRVAVIRRMSEELRPRLDEVLELVTREMGIPMRMSRALHRDMALASVENACRSAEQIQVEVEREGRAQALLRYEPVGVVGAIAPWNGPFVQSLYKVVYPLLAGCPVVFKPAPETPLNAYFVAQAATDAGLPDGLLSILPGGADVGEHLVRHPGIDAIFFTGSTEVGQHIGSICGFEMKRMVLECGGKSAAIVMEDADLEVALPPLVNGAFGNTGQNCAATSRVLVHSTLFDEVVQQLSQEAERLVVGDPADESTDLGPLINAAQLTKVRNAVESARAGGADVLVGGFEPQPVEGGYWYAPTVITGVVNSDPICQDEIFGPVVCIMPFDDLEDAIDIANDSIYGLHGAVYSRDSDAALDVARRIRAGTYSVNGFVLNSELPYGGCKLSGVGRKYGIEGILEFMEIKTINLASSTGTFAFKE